MLVCHAEPRKMTSSVEIVLAVVYGLDAKSLMNIVTDQNTALLMKITKVPN